MFIFAVSSATPVAVDGSETYSAGSGFGCRGRMFSVMQSISILIIHALVVKEEVHFEMLQMHKTF